MIYLNEIFANQRKGWDWGPVLMTAGPWKPVSLEISVAHIEHVKIDYELNSDLTTIRGAINIQTRGGCDRVQASFDFRGSKVLSIPSTVDAEGKVSLPFAIRKCPCIHALFFLLTLQTT